MMVNKSLNNIVNDKNYDLVFTSRRSNFKISDNFQNVNFPEFTNKTVN